jgi:predicted DNA-binding transcriptional regulator AlpA
MNDLVFRKHLQKNGILPLSTKTLQAMETAGVLPKPVKLGDRLYAYRRNEFDAAMAKLKGTAR